MKILTADFLVGAESSQEYPRFGLREVAFAGRSNVGKSSMINCLVGRKSLVKVSRTPGRTRKLNFFLINKQFIFVDLPGYGYAAVSRQERNKWASMVQAYLGKRRELAGVIAIVDSRHAPMASDLELIDYLQRSDISYLVVCTKVDRLTKSQLSHQRMIWENRLDLAQPPIMFSAQSGDGKTELWKAIKNLISFERSCGRTTIRGGVQDAVTEE